MALAKAVSTGSIVDVIAPSGPFDHERFRAGLGLLEKAGLRPRHRPDVFSRERFLAGSDERRAAELIAALKAPDSDLVWCARGGYGATRLLSDLPLEIIRGAGKLLIGFSDITALHARWLAAHVPSLHAPMVAKLTEEPETSLTRLLELLLTGRRPPLSGRPGRPGIAEGTLAGGNLTVLTALLGTPFQPRLEGCVLFLEDVGERPYRLDRMLVQCRQAGLFQGVVGLAFGHFTDCEEKDRSAAAEDVLHEHADRLKVPVVAALSCGHESPNEPLPLGLRVRLDAAAGTLNWLEPLYIAPTS